MPAQTSSSPTVRSDRSPGERLALLPGGFEPRHLEALREIAYQGSFVAAADVLNFTPSAISHQMARLEREVGLPLFERRPDGTRLTPAGDALLEHAETVFARLGEADEDLRRLLDGGTGRLRVGSFPTATASFVAEGLSELQSNFPDLALHLRDGEPYESAALLKSHELDVAIIFELDSWPATTDYEGKSLCGAPELECDELVDDPFLLVVPATHRLAYAGLCVLTDLGGEVILGSPTGCPPWGADLRRACSRAGVALTFEDSYETTDFQAQQAMVLAGRGVSLMPRLALAHLHPDLRALPLRGAPVRHVRFARPAGFPPNRPIARLLELLRAHATPDPRDRIDPRQQAAWRRVHMSRGTLRAGALR